MESKGGAAADGVAKKSADADAVQAKGKEKEQQPPPGETTRTPEQLGIRPEVQFALAHHKDEDDRPQRSEKSNAGQERSTRGSQAFVLGRPDDKSFSVATSPQSRTSRPSRVSRKSLVAADLESIMDNQGLLNPMVSRQMSVMSHYSVRSESGAVLISPEEQQSEFKLLKLIGRGGFGNVYLGDWDGDKVAIKIIQGYHNSDQPEEMEWEARKERMAQMEAVLMSAIEHEHIVRTFKVVAHQGEPVDPELAAVEKQLLKAGAPGAAPDNDEENGVPSFEWHIIMEYCDKGSLSRALSSWMLHTPVDAQTVKWDAWGSIEILKETTKSLIFLHENRILHGDLKAANVLLAASSQDRRKYISKVSDFGLSRVLQNNKNHIKTQTFGTVTHVPPELLSKGVLTIKADVYAVGVLMWEIFTAEKVFKQLSDSEVILAVVTKKARPVFPSDVPSRYKFLAERCWAEMVELRPSLEVVMNELENLQKSLCPQGQDSEPLLCRVYPTRQKALAEAFTRQQQYAAQQAAQAAVRAQAGAVSATQQQAAGLSRPASPGPHTSQGQPLKSALKRGSNNQGGASGTNLVGSPSAKTEGGGGVSIGGATAVAVPGVQVMPRNASFKTTEEAGSPGQRPASASPSAGGVQDGAAMKQTLSVNSRKMSPLAPANAGPPAQVQPGGSSSMRNSGKH